MGTLIWLEHRLRPRPGWLPFFLLLTLVSTLAWAVVMARWLPEVNRVGTMAVWGMLLGTLLALRPLAARWAWALFLAYGVVLTLLHIPPLRPPLATLFNGWQPISSFIRQQSLLLVARLSAWGEAIVAGESSQETMGIALGMGLVAWLLAGYAAWATFRQHQPLRGLTPIGVALAVNQTFSQIEIWPVLLFVPLAALLAAAIHYHTLVEGWEQRGVDYSPEIRPEQLAAAGAIAFCLFLLAWAIPAIRPSAIAEAVRQTAAVQEAEAVMERAFAGVRQPERASQPVDPGDGEPAEGLPRAMLIGSPPELWRTLVMTATISLTDTSQIGGVNWRGLSYDQYTGHGWKVSHWDDRTTIAAGELISPHESETVVQFTQTVHWRLDGRQTRYSLGLPLSLDQDGVATWHGPGDLARLQGEEEEPFYQIRTAVPAVTSATLRLADPSAVPERILSQYTQLPDGLPPRVRQLAAQVTAGAGTPYDQAVALERFLRQYPYTLGVTRPPTDQDLVDYFLFDLQKGYCDYYASAMVVMARSLGLPARLVVGYAAVTANEGGVQSIMQANGHSWPELYFAGVGWVSFEPTAAYLSDHTFPIVGEQAAAPLTPGVDIPMPQPVTTFPWITVLLLLLLLVGGWQWWRWQVRQNQEDGILWAYRRWQKQAAQLGHPPRPGQTAWEFMAEGDQLLQTGKRPAWLSARLTRLHPLLHRLTQLFNERQYAAAKPPPSAEGFHLWQGMARPLWLLRWWQKIGGRAKE
ncbi:MAG: transglutaminase-like domain-containing protein [Anaerolineae bacterium]|nr:transglutaminase-like domain-containing protein [Anaerolineae bacterium]